MKTELDQVKSALSSATASEATLKTLQSLLGIQDSCQKSTSTAPTKTTAYCSGNTKSHAATTASKRRGANQCSTVVKEDDASILSARSKQAFATEVVNITLKVLTTAAKARQDSRKNGSHHSTPSAKTRTPASSQRVLQPRSGNATPSPKKPEAQKEISRCTSEADAPDTQPNLVATAECACAAFQHLLAVDLRGPGTKGGAKLQLENGLLALAGRLVALRLDTAVIKCLKMAKRRLEAAVCDGSSAPPLRQAVRPKSIVQPEKVTLATLLHLSPAVVKAPDALGLAVNHQQLVLKMITLTRKSSAIEALADEIAISAASSPANILVAYADTFGEHDKTARQLESLASTILSLCPSISSANDAAACDSVSPEAAFKLQTKALQIRQMWWRMAGHKADLEKELHGPFIKCLTALVRRSLDASRAYEIAQDAYVHLGLATMDVADDVHFEICRLMSLLAEATATDAGAAKWRARMDETCRELNPQHARSVACLAEQIRRRLLSRAELCGNDKLVETAIDDLAERLKGALNGHGADYDFLLSRLSQLLNAEMFSKHGDLDGAKLKTLTALAAGFAQRYERSYPGKNTEQALPIVLRAIRFSSVPEDFDCWLSKDTVRLLVNTGTLNAISKAASTRPLAAVWSVSGDAVALGRILRALLLRAIRTRANETFFDDDDNATDAARAILLEWQLAYAMELAARPKYHECLRKCIGDMVRVLSKLYAVGTYPIRRARVATAVLRFRSSHPHLLPPHILKIWQADITVDEDQLGEDERLQPYLADVQACLAVTRAFCGGRPSVGRLIPGLRAWQSMITGSGTAQGVYERIEDVGRLCLILHSVADYMAVTGDCARIPVLRLLENLSNRVGKSQQQAVAAAELARAYLEVGHAEKAELVLSDAEDLYYKDTVPLLARLLFQIGCAECALATDNPNAAQNHLAKAQALRAEVPPERIAREDRRTYEALHVQAYLVQSKLDRSKGAPREALDAAKRAVRLANGIWAALERSNGSQDRTPELGDDEAEVPDVQRLTTGVSKLQLTPKDDQPSEGTKANDRGAAFWSILPLMCQALQQLSDLYAHHGRFGDADIYSKRAIELAGTVGASTILCKALCHRCRLLTSADDLQEAELCLTRADELDVEGRALVDAERLAAKAGLRAKEEEAKQAIALYERAVILVDNASSPTYVSKLESLDTDSVVLPEQIQSNNVMAVSQPKRLKSTKAARAPAKKQLVKKTAVLVRKATAAPASAAQVDAGRIYMLDGWRKEVEMNKTLLCLLSNGGSGSADLAQQVKSSAVGDVLQRRVEFHGLMQKASTALQSDLSYNMLPESTIAFPVFAKPSRRSSQIGRPRSSLLAHPLVEQATLKSVSKASARKAKELEGFLTILQAAKDCLSRDYTSVSGFSTTVDLHRFGSMQSTVAMLLSAATLKQPNAHLHPVRQALELELPRNYAWQCEVSTVLVDQASGSDSAPFTWPQALPMTEHAPSTAATFQEQYIDILPSTWTAVSLVLNEDCTELYAARYRSGQSPLILRLPFAKHRQDEEEHEAFDYHYGRAELKDIVEASDYTCHSAGNMEGKNAKSNWWSEREALDRRLHELLINMENIWLGGFKGILSQQRRYPDLLARFRKSFDDILGRYLPSRRTIKGRQKPVALDNKVLELFIGLGHDSDGAVDMDEPLADLLYFVVDMLQFSGEQNAYDEIDFDGMAVDVLDALRSYHEALPDDATNGHLILVLDRRLQAFPWESMPCLEGASVSRVGSTQSLRERIVAMRRQRARANAPELYEVSRKSGTYILNPSKDLKGTETMLSPSLTSLSDDEGSWKSMVQQLPSEDDFSQALSESPILLYFGHGSGAQYVRPRKIKKLDKCSEVVWLMGCSSGAVKEYGDLEPFAVPLAYLMAGRKDTSLVNAADEDCEVSDSKCMAVVAALWDVTDKDIDRFSLAMGEEWGLFRPSEGSKLPPKTPRKRTQMTASSSPQKVPKTPKTPKVAKTPVKASARSRSVSRVRQAVNGRKKSLVEAVSRSRDACYLRYLNGAAPVVYGVPVYLGD